MNQKTQRIINNSTKKLVTIGKALLAASVPIVVTALTKKSEDYITRWADNFLPIPASYSDTIKAIVNSTMFSNQKSELIDTVKPGLTEETYKSIINIVDSSMFSSSKVEAIKSLIK